VSGGQLIPEKVQLRFFQTSGDTDILASGSAFSSTSLLSGKTSNGTQLILPLHDLVKIFPCDADQLAILDGKYSSGRMV